MSQSNEFYRSIELIWAVWAVSLVALLWLTILFLRRLHWPHLRQIPLDEDGAAYTISYVMVIPLYILFMCLVVETSLVILAKFGTNYAAFAGVRSAIVHYSGENPRPDALDWAERSAKKAFVPFANGVEKPRDDRAGDEKIDLYWRAYKEYVLQNGEKPGDANYVGSERYVRAKYQYTDEHLHVDLRPVPDRTPPEEPWLEDLKLTVKYDYAFHVPLVGRLLGGQGPDSSRPFIYWTVESSATLQSEAPKNDERSLGINYEPWR